MSKFFYLGDRLNATGGCETAVTAKTKNWLDEVQEMQQNTQRQKVLIQDEREGLQKLCKVSYVVWK